MYKYVVLLAPTTKTFRDVCMAHREMFFVDAACNHMVRTRFRQLVTDNHGSYKYMLPNPWRCDGFDMWFDKSNTFIWRYFCNNGITHGIHILWSAHSGSFSTTCFRNGIRNGAETDHYSTGQPAKQYTFVNGTKHGMRMEWYIDGQLKYRGMYVAGLKQGLHEAWHVDGRLRKHTVYT